MRLKSIKIENYKSLKNVEINDLGNLVAFIGPNMAGKSNIFDALWVLHEGSKINLKHAVEKRGDFLDITWRKEPNEIIKLEFVFNLSQKLRDKLLLPLLARGDKSAKLRIYNSNFLKELCYELRFALQQPNPFYTETLSTLNIDTGQSRLIIIEKKFVQTTHQLICKINNLQDQFVNVLKGSNFSEHFRESKSSWLYDSTQFAFVSDFNQDLSTLEDKLIEKFKSFIHSLQWLNPFRNIRDEIKISSAPTLLPDASNLADILHTLSNNDPVKFSQILPLLKSVIPGIEYLSTPTTKDIASAGLQETGQLSSKVYKLLNFSAGTKNLLSIFALLLTSEEGGLVLIEEPEVHLHPEAVRMIVKILRDQASNKQVMISTHSPTVLLNFNIDNVYLVGRDEERNTKVEQVTYDNAMQIIEQLGIQPSDFLDYDVIIFVEGPFDEDIFKTFAKKVKIDTNGFCFISTDGWTNMKYYANASILQRRRVCPSIIGVFDGDLEKRPKAKREKDNMLRRMRVPKDNIFNLQLGEIECYLLDAEAWFRVWPSLKEKVSEEELKNEFEKIKQSEKQKECMEKLMESLGLESYTRKIAIKIVNNMSSVPDEIEEILKQAKNLIDENSK